MPPPGARARSCASYGKSGSRIRFGRCRLSSAPVDPEAFERIWQVVDAAELGDDDRLDLASHLRRDLRVSGAVPCAERYLCAKVDQFGKAV